MTNTPRTARRSRRAVAAISAVLLGASVLAVATGGPVSAANTASEVLIDHDNNASTAKVRQFGGTDRYDTALRLAKQFADSRGGLGAITTAFLASGESLVDAVSVAGLAGYLDAPVVLTPSGSLHGGVEDFIEDYGIDSIWILGGTAAVSEGVEAAVKALDNTPTVTRIAGADRYETAALIGRELDGISQWCGTFSNSAILVNGASNALFDAVTVSPLANRLQMPMLLTRTDELPQHTIDFIRDEDIEYVAIIGGQAGVSSAVAGALSAAGVDTVTRYAGASAAETSAVVAKLAVSGDCSNDLAPVAPSTVALVNQNGIPDGIAASPALNGNLSGVSGLVPILLVGDSLPSAVSSYLAATPEEDASGNKIQFDIVAIGGNAAVTPGVMTAALRAAASAPALSVQIVSPKDWDNDGQKDDAPRAGETSFELHFSDDIAGSTDNTSDETVALREKLLDVLRIAGVPAVLLAQNANPAGVDFGADSNTNACKPDQITVNLASALTANQRISIADTNIAFGASSDKRPLDGTSTTVQSKETNSPTFEIISIVGQSSFTVIAKDNRSNDTGLANGAALASAEVSVSSGTNTVSSVSGNAVDTSSGRVTEATFTVNMGSALVSGDRIKIAANAIADAAGNGNSERTSPAPLTPTKSPRLSSIRVSNQFHDIQAQYAVPTALTGGNGGVGGEEDVFFIGKANGNAGGAKGNGWTFDFRKASTYDANKPVSIEVLVNTSGKRAFITFAGGKPKFADLAAALRAHSVFNSLWEVSIDNVQNSCAVANKALVVQAAVTAPGDDSTSADKVRDGNTKMAIEATFSGYVQTVYSNALLEDAFAATALRVSGAQLSDIALGSQGDKTGPIRTARWVASTEDVTRLPKSNDRVDVTAGSIALGYAADDSNTTNVNESQNPAQSNLRIGTGAATPR